MAVGSDGDGVGWEDNRVVDDVTEGRDLFEGVKMNFDLLRTSFHKPTISDLSNGGPTGCEAFVG